jgi:hypothetical protein
MSVLYNKYGVMKNEQVQETSDKIDNLARQLFKDLIADEVSLSDIHLAAAYLEHAIEVTACEEILRKSMKMTKDERRISVDDTN